MHNLLSAPCDRDVEMVRGFDALHAVLHASPKYGSRLDPNDQYTFLHSRQTAREVRELLLALWLL